VEALRGPTPTGIPRAGRGHAAPPRWLTRRRGPRSPRPECEDETARSGAEEDRKALVEAPSGTGTISCVATDHAPHCAAREGGAVRGGAVRGDGLETAVSALYTHLVEPGLISLETLLERYVGPGPAAAYWLDAPKIAGRRAANAFLLDTQASWQVSRGRLPSAARRTPWLIGEKAALPTSHVRDDRGPAAVCTSH
jgi:hypothetical protein